MGVMLANVERLALEAQARAWAPPPPVDYLAWAENNIVFTEAESQFPGPYSRSRFPFFDEILRALSPDDPCRFVTVKGSAQVGKTVIANIFTACSMAMTTGAFLYCHPTDDNAERWSKMKLDPLLRSTSSLRLLFPERSRDGGNSLHFKERSDGLMQLLITGANSPASLSQVTIFRQVQDDLSKWEMNVAGDPEGQANNRSRAIEFAKILKISTPLVEPGCRITKNFKAGSQEFPYVPCPQCGHEQVLEWANMLAQLDPAHPEDAHFSCVSCGFPIEEHHRPQLLAGLKWRAHNEAAKREHRSFWIWSAYSYLQSFERIAREWLAAKGDIEAERTFLNDTAGEVYEAKGEAPPWEKLRDRAAASRYARGQIPSGGLVVGLGIDCQADRVEWHAVSFGRRKHRFVIDYGVIGGHVSSSECREKLDALLSQTWPNAFGRWIGIDVAAIDGNAWTDDVFGWANRHPRSKLIMVRGIQGDSAPRFARVKRERNEKTGKLLRYASRFYNVGVSGLKMELYRDLAVEDPLGECFISFPRGLDDEYFRMLTAERRVPVKKNGFVQYKWDKDPNQANEALDNFLQATAAAIKWGVRGLPDAIWEKLEAERETPGAPAQGDLEDLLSVRKFAQAVPAKVEQTSPALAAPAASSGRRSSRSNYMD